jgi:hypothetical protein
MSTQSFNNLSTGVQKQQQNHSEKNGVPSNEWTKENSRLYDGASERSRKRERSGDRREGGEQCRDTSTAREREQRCADKAEERKTMTKGYTREQSRGRLTAEVADYQPMTALPLTFDAERHLALVYPR